MHKKINRKKKKKSSVIAYSNTYPLKTIYKSKIFPGWQEKNFLKKYQNVVHSTKKDVIKMHLVTTIWLGIPWGSFLVKAKQKDNVFPPQLLLLDKREETIKQHSIYRANLSRKSKMTYVKGNIFSQCLVCWVRNKIRHFQELEIYS